MSQTRPEDVMRTYLTEVLNKRRFELIPEFAAPDMIDHTQPTLRGPEALDAHARGFCDNIPDLEIEVVRIFGNDTTAVGLWRWHGTPKQPNGYSASGKPVSPRFIGSIFDFEDGKLVEYRALVDAVDVISQIRDQAAA
jgi:predicted ester cyclase